MSPRTGRPKLDNAKSCDIRVRITNELNVKLEEYCKSHSITKAEAIRRFIEKNL